MGLPPLTKSLITKVVRRRRWTEFGRRFVQVWWWLAGFFLLGLFVSRFSALLPDVFTFGVLACLPALAAVLAWFGHRRVRDSEAARIVDRYQGNHDLFLTAVHLEASAGTYQERIRERAESVAGREEVMSEVVPWSWHRPCWRILGAVVVLMGAIQWLPQWDPFGKDEERQWLGKQEDRLEALERETEAQLKALKPEEAAERDEDIQQSLSKLREAFRLARPEEQRETARRLSESQKELGQFWKQLNDEKLRKALDEASERMQQFGRSEATLTPEAKAMRDQLREMLREGESKALQQRLAEMLENAESLVQPGKTAEERRQGAKELQRSLQELAAAVANEAPSEALKDTLQRAIEQMQLAQNEGLGEKAMEGAQRSMEQLQQQLEGLSQQLQQLQRLEEALDAARLAQRLNEMGKMPGAGEGEGGEGEAMKDYAELYRELLAQAGGGNQPGPGMGRRGSGEGGLAPEDEDQETAFVDEKSPSHLVAGKTLLEWKTEGVSEAGEAQEVYQESIRQLKQDLSEAIRQEQVPAGYHSQIRNYFDLLDEEPPSVDDLD